MTTLNKSHRIYWNNLFLAIVHIEDDNQIFG